MNRTPYMTDADKEANGYNGPTIDVNAGEKKRRKSATATLTVPAGEMVVTKVTRRAPAKPKKK